MNIYTQSCGLIILLILLFFDMKHKKVGLFSETVYLNTILINAIGVLIDLLAVMMLSNFESFGMEMVTIWGRVRLAAIIAVGYTIICYILSGFYSGRKYVMLILKHCAIPLIEISGAMALPFTFVQDGAVLYMKGPAVIVTFVSMILYAVAAIMIAELKRKKLGRRRCHSIIGWMGIVIITITLETVAGGVYAFGFACAVGMMIMYFALENPESNLDRSFGCFNSHVLLPYLTQIMKRGDRFCLIYLSMAEAKSAELDDEELDDKLRSIIDYINSFPYAKVFKNVDQEFIAVLPDEGKLQKIIHGLRNRYYYDQFTLSDQIAISNSRSSYPKSLIVILKDNTVATDPMDILRVFETLRETNKDNLSSTRINLCKSHFDQLREREQIIREIRSALDEDRIEVYYQPIYSIKDGKFISAEALARIRREDDSIVPPGKFIQIAEETGLILKLGERVFEKTCQFIKSGLPAEHGIEYFEVNLSVIQCEQNDLAQRYIDIMDANGINPHNINLEITETATIQAKRKLQQNMKQLIEYGVEFSLDDFGNGHSNLDYVIDMPVDIVKLDMSLIQAYESEKKAKAVVQAAVRMIVDMELNALTEGVETREQLEEMQRIGVNFIQGFYFSKPIPENEFIEFLKKNQGVAG